MRHSELAGPVGIFTGFQTPLTFLWPSHNSRPAIRDVQTQEVVKRSCGDGKLGSGANVSNK